MRVGKLKNGKDEVTGEMFLFMVLMCSYFTLVGEVSFNIYIYYYYSAMWRGIGSPRESM